MSLDISVPEQQPVVLLEPQITVIGVGGAGGNAINNMIQSNLEKVDFVVANTDAQALKASLASKKIQLGVQTTKGQGAGARPEGGKESAEEAAAKSPKCWKARTWSLSPRAWAAERERARRPSLRKWRANATS